MEVVVLVSSRSLQLVQMLQSCQHNLLARLFNLASKKDLVQNCIHLDFHQSSEPPVTSACPHLVKVEHQVELADVAKELV